MDQDQIQMMNNDVAAPPQVKWGTTFIPLNIQKLQEMTALFKVSPAKIYVSFNYKIQLQEEVHSAELLGLKDTKIKVSITMN